MGYFQLPLYPSLTNTSRYFGVDIKAIQEYAETHDDIQHLRAQIRLVTKKCCIWWIK